VCTTVSTACASWLPCSRATQGAIACSFGSNREERAAALQQQLAGADKAAAQLRTEADAARADVNSLTEASAALQAAAASAEAEAARVAAQGDEEEAAWRRKVEAVQQEQRAAVRAIQEQHAAELEQVGGAPACGCSEAACVPWSPLPAFCPLPIVAPFLTSALPLTRVPPLAISSCPVNFFSVTSCAGGKCKVPLSLHTSLGQPHQPPALGCGHPVSPPCQVHSKLRSVLRRKDARLAALRAQAAAAEGRQRQTEALLERQRGAIAALTAGAAAAGRSVGAGGVEAAQQAAARGGGRLAGDSAAAGRVRPGASSTPVPGGRPSIS
jgi:hypothetical protein